MPKGEKNAKTQLSDAEVELIRQLYEGDRYLPRDKRVWTGKQLAVKFEISLRHVWYILSYERRYSEPETE